MNLSLDCSIGRGTRVEPLPTISYQSDFVNRTGPATLVAQSFHGCGRPLKGLTAIKPVFESIFSARPMGRFVVTRLRSAQPFPHRPT